MPRVTTCGAPCRTNEHRILRALGDRGVRHLKQVAHVLSIASSLDQRAGLERSRDAAKEQRISGLVEQVSCLCLLLAAENAVKSQGEIKAL